MIPGVSETCAATILAEIGPDVKAFQSDAHLASWLSLIHIYPDRMFTKNEGIIPIRL